jgi:hypothetical protein
MQEQAANLAETVSIFKLENVGGQPQIAQPKRRSGGGSALRLSTAA